MRARASRKRSASRFQHLVPGEHVVAEGDGLRGLQVGEAGHDGIGLALGDVHYRPLQPAERGHHLVGLLSQHETQIGNHLVVARAPGVELLPRFPDAADERGLDVHVDIFERRAPLEAARLDLGLDALQSLDDRRAFRLAQHPHLREHGGMRDGAGDVVAVEAPVEVLRCRETLHQRVGRLAEPSAPGLVVRGIGGHRGGLGGPAQTGGGSISNARAEPGPGRRQEPARGAGTASRKEHSAYSTESPPRSPQRS